MIGSLLAVIMYCSDDALAWLSLALVASLLLLPLVASAFAGRLDVFEPIFLVAISYFLYFVVAPAFDLLNDNTIFFGKEIRQLIPKGSIYASLGILSMFLGYYNNIGIRLSRLIPRPTKSVYGSVRYGLFLGGLGVILFSAFLRGVGLSWIRLLSFGQFNRVPAVAEAGIIDSPFYNYLWSTMDWFAGSFMILYAFANRWRRALLPIFIAIFAVYCMMGFRFRVLILVMAPLIYHFLRNRRRPKTIHIVGAIVLGFLIIGGLGAIRGNLRSATRIAVPSFKTIFETFLADLAIYQPFLVVIDAIPRVHDYYWGSSYAYVFIQPIPRALWPDKPLAPIRDIISVSFGSEIPAQAGVFYPNLGEFYANYGLIGIVVGMFLFGISMRTLYEYLRRHADNEWARILFALSLPFLVQVVSRGYTVQIIQEATFIIAPIIVGMWLSGRRTRRQLSAFRPEMSASVMHRRV